MSCSTGNSETQCSVLRRSAIGHWECSRLAIPRDQECGITGLDIARLKDISKSQSQIHQCATMVDRLLSVKCGQESVIVHFSLVTVHAKSSGQ